MFRLPAWCPVPADVVKSGPVLLPHASSVVATAFVAVQLGYVPEIAQHSLVVAFQMKLSALLAAELVVTSVHTGVAFPAVAAYCDDIAPMLVAPAVPPPVLPRLSSRVTTTTATTIAPPMSSRYSSAPCPLLFMIYLPLFFPIIISAGLVAVPVG